MSVSYYKRFRMEIDLRGRRLDSASLPPGYRLVAWSPEILGTHAETKFHSFRHEIDADVFNCLADLDGCYRLMHEISLKDGFLPEATWLAAYVADGELEYCGTIQGIRATSRYGGIQNVGITPAHRGRGVGSALLMAALRGFQQVGLPRAYLEVTAQNERAVHLYKRLGFQRTKTLFKAVELAYSDPCHGARMYGRVGLRYSSFLRQNPEHRVSAEILSHTLSNGLVLVGEPRRSMESAAFTFLLAGGCAYDSPGRAGLAALTGEMLQRGAGSRDSRAWISELENLGVERGESVGVAQATFSGATLRDNLGAALELYADLLRRPHLPADQFEMARSTCLQELRAIEDEPSHKLMIELRRRRYPDPWGRSNHGDEASLRAAAIDDVRRFHARHYRPGGAILAVAGNIDWPRVCDRVEQLFGDWDASDDAMPIGTQPQPDGNYIPFESSQSHIGIAYPTIPYKHSDYFQAWAAVGVLSSGSSSRLFTEVRERQGLCYTVYATLHTQRDRASVLCYAGTTVERAQKTLDTMVGELERLGKGIEQGELDRLKARIKSSLIMQQESTSARSGAIGRDWYHLGRARTLDEVGRLVDNLSADSINTYLKSNPPRDLMVVTLGPEPLKMPADVA